MALYLRAAKVASRSPGPYAELFARRPRLGWQCWGLECEDYAPAETYACPAQAEK
jgi:hypothetical protein